MAQNSLSRQEYELDLKRLAEELRLCLDGAGGDAGRLLRDAESLIELSGAFPDVYERHKNVEGLVAELLARRQQEQSFPKQSAGADAPGCMLGWLFRKSRHGSGSRPRCP